jgi:MinD superfamily P-loop ATPase
VKSELILNDGPPGIGCPVIAAVGDIDAGLIVVEPTLSSIHDMERALALLNHFEISPLVCINKYDINRDNTSTIISFCEANDVKVVGQIPFDPLVTKAMVAGQPIVEYASDSSISKAITKVWTQTLEYLMS